MAATTIPPKDPSAVLFYQVDWTAWLGTDSIQGTPTITITGGDGLLTLNPNGHSTAAAAGVVTFWLGAGTAGQFYTVACEITTAAGRTDSRTFLLEVATR
jgi:hypothetical protein